MTASPFLRRALAAVLVPLGLATGPGCRTVRPPAPAVASPGGSAPSFASADALAAWLRASHPDGPRVSAHRGGPHGLYPENALETFAHTLATSPLPVLLETDVRLTRDSVFVLLHDDTLDRTTTGTGRLDEHTLDQVRALRLRAEDGTPTPYRVPTLAEALAWGRGRAVFTLEPKRDQVPPAAFVRAIRAARAEPFVVVITYTPEQYAEYLRLAPDLAYSVTTPTLEALDRVLAVPGADPCRMIAFVGTGAPTPLVNARLHRLDVRAMQGVFGLREAQAREDGPRVLAPMRRLGVDVFATGAVEAALGAPPPLSPPEGASCRLPGVTSPAAAMH